MMEDEEWMHQCDWAYAKG